MLLKQDLKVEDDHTQVRLLQVHDLSFLSVIVVFCAAVAMTTLILILASDM